VLDAITTTAEKVAGPAIFASGPSYALCDFVPFRWMIGLFVTFEDHRLRGGVTGTCRKFFIGPCLFVTNEAIDICLVCEIKIIIFPTIAGMT